MANFNQQNDRAFRRGSNRHLASANNSHAVSEHWNPPEARILSDHVLTISYLQNAANPQATWHPQNPAHQQLEYQQGLNYQQPYYSQAWTHPHPAYTYNQQVATYQQPSYYGSQYVARWQPWNYAENQHYAGWTQTLPYHQQSNPYQPVAYDQNSSGSGVPGVPYHLQQASYPAMAYSGWNNAQYSQPQYNHQYPPGYDAYAQQPQQPQQYQPDAPQIRNPFAPPPAARSQYAGQNADHDPEYEAQVAQWQSAYAPQDQSDRGKKGAGKAGEKGENPNFTEIGVRQGPTQTKGESNDASTKVEQGEKKKTVMRKGGGQSWEDDTLLEWDPTQFRIMVGNLAGEVTDDSLAKAFAQYGVSKARVVRDKRTTKSKGYGFVSFTDGELGFKAAREMVGKYIGSHPVTIQRSKTDLRPVMRKDKDKGKHNKHKNEGGKNQNDPLKAHTGAHIEKKPVKNPAYKLLG